MKVLIIITYLMLLGFVFFFYSTGYTARDEITELKKELYELKDQQGLTSSKVDHVLGQVEEMIISQGDISGQLACIISESSRKAQANASQKQEPEKEAKLLFTAKEFKELAYQEGANNALGKARYFDHANPYEDKEIVAAKYMDVVNRYPNTVAASEAAQKYEEVMRRRK